MVVASSQRSGPKCLIYIQKCSTSDWIISAQMFHRWIGLSRVVLGLVKFRFGICNLTLDGHKYWLDNWYYTTGTLSQIGCNTHIPLCAGSIILYTMLFVPWPGVSLCYPCLLQWQGGVLKRGTLRWVSVAEGSARD